MSVNLDVVKNEMDKDGFTWFNQPGKLNLVLVRNPEDRGKVSTNKFNDKIIVQVTKPNGENELHNFNITTDPGHTYLINPINKKWGTAVIAKGQYSQSYIIGHHRDNPNHKAFLQNRPVKVHRDNNRDLVVNLDNRTIDWENPGLNGHRGFAKKKTEFVDEFSAGCWVFDDANNLNTTLNIAEKFWRENNNGNYTITVLQPNMDNYNSMFNGPEIKLPDIVEIKKPTENKLPPIKWPLPKVETTNPVKKDEVKLPSNTSSIPEIPKTNATSKEQEVERLLNIALKKFPNMAEFEIPALKNRIARTVYGSSMQSINIAMVIKR